MTKRTILFLAANPLGTDRLALDAEARAIQAELERSGHRDRFELVTRWAVQPLDLLRELRKLKPTIVHFSGHGVRGTAGRDGESQRDVIMTAADSGFDAVEGLCFEGADGQLQLVSTAALEGMFGAAGSFVKLVILSACYSEPQATAVAAHVDCVIGMRGSIPDASALSFAIGFYGGLGEYESIAGAYRQGCAAFSIAGLHSDNRPQLKVRDGIDAEKVILAEQRVRSRMWPLRFAALTMDSSISGWHRNWHRRAVSLHSLSGWLGQERAFLSVATSDGSECCDPVFDITMVNMSDGPVVLGSLGVEIVRASARPDAGPSSEFAEAPDAIKGAIGIPETRIDTMTLSGISSGRMPNAAAILKSQLYDIDMADVVSDIDFADLLVRHSAVSEVPVEIDRMYLQGLPDPIYFEAGAPYRFALRLGSYARHVPSLARIRICASTDEGVSRSQELELLRLHELRGVLTARS